MLPPMIADSASGVSITRCSPKSLSRPSVMRKTPPRVPTSSPSRTTRSSASMASRRAVLSALAMVICAIGASLNPRPGTGPRTPPAAGTGPSGWPAGRRRRGRPGRRGAGRARARPGARPPAAPGPPRPRPHPRGPQPVGDGLDQGRPGPVARPLGRRPGHRVHGQDVVAVHLDPGEAEAEGPLVDGPGHLLGQRHRDRPLVVLAEEHHRGAVHGGEVERLADVALAGGAVAEVGDGADLGPVPLGADGVADGVQGLGADGDRVKGQLVALGVPAGQVGPAVEAEDRQHLHAGPDVDDAVLAVGGEHKVVRPERPGAADLGRLLAKAGRPDAELALTLKVVALDVDAPHHHQLAVQVAEVLVGQVDLVGVVLEERPVLAEQPNLLVGLVHASVSRVVAPDSPDPTRPHASNTQAPGTGERRSGGLNTPFNTQKAETVWGHTPWGAA